MHWRQGEIVEFWVLEWSRYEMALGAYLGRDGQTKVGD